MSVLFVVSYYQQRDYSGQVKILEKNRVFKVMRIKFFLGAPVITSLVETNLFIIEGRVEEYLLVVPPLNSLNVTINVEVFSVPCPTVQWKLNGTNILKGDLLYFYNNPCTEELNTFLYRVQFYLIIISQLTSATSGEYSALFNNMGYSNSRSLPYLYVTIPGRIVCLLLLYFVK